MCFPPSLFKAPPAAASGLMNVPRTGSWLEGARGGWAWWHAARTHRQCSPRLWLPLCFLHMVGGTEKRHVGVGRFLPPPRRGEETVNELWVSYSSHISLGISSHLLVQVMIAALRARVPSASLSRCHTWSTSVAMSVRAMSTHGAASLSGL